MLLFVVLCVVNVRLRMCGVTVVCYCVLVMCVLLVGDTGVVND